MVIQYTFKLKALLALQPEINLWRQSDKDRSNVCWTHIQQTHTMYKRGIRHSQEGYNL